MGFLDVGVWGLSSVRGVIHWGKGSVLSSSTTKPYGGEQQESALNPFPGPLLQGYMQKLELFRTHHPPHLLFCLSHLFSVSHPCVAIITAISNSNVSLLPGFITSLLQNVSSAVCNAVTWIFHFGQFKAHHLFPHGD